MGEHRFYKFSDITRIIFRYIIVWLVDVVSLLATAAIIPGVSLMPSGETSIWVVATASAFLLGIVNLLLRPLILLMALPLGFFVLFAAGFVTNAIVLRITASLMLGFQVTNWASAFLGGLFLAVINTIITSILTIDDDDSFYQGLVERLAMVEAKPEGSGDGQGLLMIEIDGLSYWHMQKAIQEGWMPTVKKMVDKGGYALSRVDCGLPSQTSACQAGIMFGDNHDIPAFRWYDKDLGRLIVSSHDTPMINDRIANGNGLMRGGSSINNMMDGDAEKSLLTLADLRAGTPEENKRRSRDIYLLMLNPYFFMRTMVLFFADVFVELWQGWKQRARNVQPRLNRLQNFYPFLRAATTVFMRDVAAYLVILDIIRGSPSIYVTWPGYDEVAHHSGPWTNDAFNTLQQYDRTIARLLDIIERKAPRPYEVIILSDHGQSFGATFKQRYGQDLKQFIESLLPQGTSISKTSGGDDGSISVMAMADEFQNIQDQDIAGKIGKPILKQTQKVFTQNVEKRVEPLPLDTASVTVCGSGNLAQVYFDLAPGKVPLSTLNAAYDGLVEAIVAHEGIGFVVGYADDGAPLAVSKDGSINLHTGVVQGENPLEPYGDPALRAWQIRRIADFPHAGDLIVNSALYPDGTVAAMEELIGSHGGLGGEQTDAFLLHPADLKAPSTKSAVDIFPILDSRRGLAVKIPEPAQAPIDDVTGVSLKRIMAEIREIQSWIPLAGRALILDRSVFSEVAADRRMGGPALLIGVIGAILFSLSDQGTIDLSDMLFRIAAWFISIAAVFYSARLLGGKESGSATFRVMGFAQSASILLLLSVVPVLGDISRLVTVIVTFFAAWIGVSEVHGLKSWRNILLPLVYAVIYFGSLAIFNNLLSGIDWTFESLLRSFGIAR